MRAHGPNLGFPAELHSVRGKALEVRRLLLVQLRRNLRRRAKRRGRTSTSTSACVLETRQKAIRSAISIRFQDSIDTYYLDFHGLGKQYTQSAPCHSTALMLRIVH